MFALIHVLTIPYAGSRGLVRSRDPEVCAVMLLVGHRSEQCEMLKSIQGRPLGDKLTDVWFKCSAKSFLSHLWEVGGRTVVATTDVHISSTVKQNVLPYV